MPLSPEDEGRESARRFRREHGFGDEPLDDMIDVLNLAGIDVVVMVLPDDSPEAGLTMHDPVTKETVVAVAASPVSGRQRFTLAHELGHHLRGEHQSGQETHGARTPSELACDSFARHLLLPMPAVMATRRSEPNARSAVNALVRRFDVSPAVAIIQLAHAGLEAGELDACRRLSARNLAANYGWLDIWQQRSEAANRAQGPRVLLRRLAAAHRDGMTTVSELAAWSNVSRDDLTAALAEGTDEAGE